MAALTYFTARLRYQTVVADEATDVDTDPQTKGIYAGVTITPFIRDSDGIDASELQAATLTPDVAMLVLSPIRARLDAGVLMLRVDPDRPVENHANLAAFPGTGNTAKLYRAQNTGLVYAWNGSTYVQTDDYTPVRLVAQTAVLGLPEGATLNYRLDFDHVTFNGGEQELASFAVAAPTSDIVVDLATAPRVSD